MRKIILVAHNIRSTHNVGSLLRTAEGLGVEKVFLTGYTPYPATKHDTRLPHLAQKINKQISKTALGAENSQAFEHSEDIGSVLERLRDANYTLVAVEQSNKSTTLPNFVPPQKVALLVGREVEGVESEILEAMDKVLEIPMFGKKESFNVAQAAAMALYHCRFA